MERKETVEFVVAIFDRSRSASQGYQAVKDTYYESNALDRFDTIVVGRQDTGNVKLFRMPEFPTRYSEWAGAGWGLAAGLAVALYPDAATDAGFRAAGCLTGSLAVIAAHVSSGVGRAAIKELGELVDGGDAALIIAAEQGQAVGFQALLRNADAVRSCSAEFDLGQLESQCRAARAEVSGASRAGVPA